MATDDHWRIDHTGMGVSNITKAAKFYDAALGALGLKPIARITKTFAVARGRNDPDLGGVGYGVSYPISGSMCFTHMERSSTPPFERAAAAKSRTFTALRFLLAAKIMVARGSAPATIPLATSRRSFWIQTATTSRPSSGRANGGAGT